MRITKPIPGHSYHDKLDVELLYILKDAREAAAAMRGHDARAEAKYLDQINDACTVLNYRNDLLAQRLRKEA